MTNHHIPEGYLLGIEDIDQQHNVLFQYIDNLDTAINDGDSWVVVHHTLADLDHWTQVHFAVEESVMRICGFPDLAHHISQHTIFVQRITAMKLKSLTTDISIEASQFLHDWLKNHINIEDRRYADYFTTLSKLMPAQPLAEP